MSAFVGSGSELYLPKPEGIELICWPKPGSTNPNTIRELIKRGVSVSFSSQMHVKLYWTLDKGAVVTSANLSSAALGSGGQIEIGIYVDSSAIDIEKVLRYAQPHPVNANSLRSLEFAHHEFIKKNPHEHIRTRKPRDFNAWFDSVGREAWKFTTWDVGGINLSSNAKTLLKEEFEKKACNSWMSAGASDCHDNDWILCLRETSKRLGAASWMFAHFVVPVPTRERKKLNDGFPAQILQVGSLRNYEQPPFSLKSKKVQSAIKRAYKELRIEEPNPTRKFIEKIHKYYNE